MRINQMPARLRVLLVNILGLGLSYGIDQFTQGEAGHLKNAQSVDAIRDRISAARDAAGWGKSQGLAAGKREDQTAGLTGKRRKEPQGRGPYI